MILGKEFKKLYKDPRIVQENFKHVFEIASVDDLEEAKGWYDNANSFASTLAERGKMEAYNSAGIISALSPSTSWEENVIRAETFVNTGRLSGHIPQQITKAKNIMLTDCPTKVAKILNGPKTVSFFYNIYNPSLKEYVTIDRHMLNLACRIEGMIDPTPKQYHFLAEETIKFSNYVNLIPNQVQAILWVTWRKVKRNYVT